MKLPLRLFFAFFFLPLPALAAPFTVGVVYWSLNIPGQVAMRRNHPPGSLDAVFPITHENLEHYPGWMGPVPRTIKRPWPPYSAIQGNLPTW